MKSLWFKVNTAQAEASHPWYPRKVLKDPPVVTVGKGHRTSSNPLKPSS